MNDSYQDLSWWQRGVIYQIYPRSFKDTTGNGVGDLQGIIEQLDYLGGTQAALPIDAIWLSPVYPSPMADFGYDVADYCDIDPLFGDMATFDALVAAAHARGLKIIMDYVPNHSSDQHPWFIASRSSRDNPRRDWYIWRDPAPDGGPPNNWGSFFGGPAWTLDEKTGQYYMHQFCPEQPELNWRNPEVRAAMYDVLRFWMEHGVDGFRMDVIGLIIKDAELRDNPPNPNAPDNLPENDLFSRLIQKYNLDQDDIHPILREMRAVLDEYDGILSIGELWFEWPRWVQYFGTEALPELDHPINFRLAQAPWDAATMRHTVEELEGILPDHAWPNYVLASHDYPRLTARFGGQGPARIAAMMLLTLRGTPTVYYGDELGMENGDIPPEKIQDPQGINLGPERTRDVARTPMQWTDGPNAGFCPADVEPWLPISDDYQERNVAVKSDDPTSILTLYRRLLTQRRATPALYGGAYRAVNVAEDSDCYVYLREAGEQRRLIALNFVDEPRLLNIPNEDEGRVALSTHLDREEIVSLNALELRPHEGVIIEL